VKLKALKVLIIIIRRFYKDFIYGTKLKYLSLIYNIIKFFLINILSRLKQPDIIRIKALYY
jgi:hypothetical protein